MRLLVILALLIQPFAALGRVSASCDMGSTPVVAATDECCTNPPAHESCCCCTSQSDTALADQDQASPHAVLVAASHDLDSSSICDPVCRTICETAAFPYTTDARKATTLGGKGSSPLSQPVLSTLAWSLRLALIARVPSLAIEPAPGVHERLALLCIWTT